MYQSESIVKLVPALIAAQKDMGTVHKSEKNKHYGYAYAALEDYLDVVSTALEKHGLCVVTSNPSAMQLADRQTKGGGTEHAVQVGLSMTLLHSSGEYIRIEVCGQAQDVGDKAIFQAITGARKYGFACMFNLVTSDDPERTGKKQEQKRQTTSRTNPSTTESTKTDSQKEIKLEIHNRLVKMYGKDYAEKGTLEQLTEWRKDDGGIIPGIKSLREKINDRRLGVIRGKVSNEYKKFLKAKENADGELPF